MSRGENCEPVIGHPGFTPDLTSRNLPNTHELRFSEEVSHLFPGIAHESDSFSSHFIPLKWITSVRCQEHIGIHFICGPGHRAGWLISWNNSAHMLSPAQWSNHKMQTGGRSKLRGFFFYFLFIPFPLFFLQHGPFFSSKLKLKEAGLLGRATAKLHQERRSATANTGRSSGGNTAA